MFDEKEFKIIKFNKINLFLIKIFLLFFICGCTDKKYETPEEVVRAFVEFTSEGKCEKARELCTVEAQLVVDGMIESGCEPYESRIDSITCTIIEDTAKCLCYEFIEKYQQEIKFQYKLLKIDNQWKLSVITKSPGETQD